MDILQRERLLKFGAIPFTTDVIAGELGDYSAVLAKIAALVDEGSLVRIKRGLYCLSPKISGHDLDSRVVANALYGPSYVSFESGDEIRRLHLASSKSPSAFSGDATRKPPSPELRVLTPIGNQFPGTV